MNKLPLMISVAAIGAAALLTGCSSTPDFIGIWKSTSPTTITDDIMGARDASSDLTVAFSEGAASTGGSVTIDNALTVAYDMAMDSVVYSLSATGFSEVSGEWTYDVDDDDDLLLSIDYSTLSVDFPVENIVIKSDAVLSDEQTTTIKKRASEILVKESTIAVSKILRRMSVISDLKTNDGKTTLAFEIQSPEEDLRFMRAQ